MRILFPSAHRHAFVFGLFLILHGLAHTAIGMAAQDVPHGGIAASLPPSLRTVVATILFLGAMPGFVGAGLGLWGVAGLRRIWRPLTTASVLASIFLIALFAPPPLRMVIGIVLDGITLALVGSFALARDFDLHDETWRKA